MSRLTRRGFVQLAAAGAIVPRLAFAAAGPGPISVWRTAGTSGGADDPLGPTVLVAGRPQTRAALEARGRRLVARGDDPTMSNEAWLRTWKRLNDAWQRLPR
jgi:hypothetical protein